MKHFFFLLFILLTWYMAAMYRLHSLMVLAVAELMLLFFLFLLSRYFKRSFQAGFCNGKEVLRQGEKTGIRIWTENRAVFPIGRYRLDFYCGFKKPRQKKIISREGSIDSRKREVEELYWEFPWCGRFYVSLVQRQVYDYLSLFRARMKDDQETEISVLPSCQPLLLKFSSLDSWENRGYGEEFSVLQGNSGEVRQLREYGPGDLVRRIHWKQSARTDKILVKEFQREDEDSVSLYLELSREKEPGAEEKSAFYQILSALILGLLRERSGVKVSWKNSEKQSLFREIKSEEECMAFLLSLYDTEDGIFYGNKSQKNPEKDFVLNLDREIFYQGNLVYTFSLKNCEQELEEIQIILP